MSDLYGIGLSGLTTARTGVNTAGNNIANVNTPGYTRRTVDVAEAGQGGASAGSRVTGVNRQYSEFLTSQLNDSESSLNASQAQLDQVSQIDNLLADNDAGVGRRVQDFFDSLQTLAASPSDSAARTAVIGDAQDMATRFRAFADRMDDIESATQQRIEGAVGQVNNNVAQIDTLNDEIIRARATSGGEPNQLLDTRDRLISETNNLIGVDVIRDNEDRVSLTVAGQPLLDAGGVTQLGTRPSLSGTGSVEVFSQSASGQARSIDAERIQSGEIGGLLAVDRESIHNARGRLNQTAAVLSEQVNNVQQAGIDQNGDPGRPLFSAPEPSVASGTDNNSDARVSATFTPGASAELSTASYQLTRNDAGYVVSEQPGGRTVATAETDARRLDVGGVTLAIDGEPAVGDTYRIDPLANAAAGLTVAVDDESQIASGRSAAPGDNRNVDAMAKLAQADIVGGNRTLSENYAQLVGSVGNETASLQTDRNSQQALTDEIRQSRESVSGVNLDEENVDLMYYQQMYQANSQVIRTASTLFDTILGIGR